jgi:50S ribosomal protein L16 3-hydroxylase
MTATGHVQRHGLASLITPLDPPTFMNEFWGKKCFYTQVDLGATGDLPNHLAGCSTQELLAMAQDPVVVMHRTASGNYRGTRVAAPAALDFYEAKASLYFDLSRNISGVASWIAALAENLGQRQSAVKVSVFVSPGGGATECHFDSNENFTIQLRGHKRWKMAPNFSVTNPTDRFTITGDVQALMALYWKNEMPVNLELNEIVDLAPGTMLYVPRGYWHTVEVILEFLHKT